MKPEIAEILAKCKAGLIDYQANVNTIDFEKFATDMKNEQEFLNGLQKQLVPWMDEAEVTANKNLQKPGNFEDAREIEKQCVMFAKEVRKANLWGATSSRTVYSRENQPTKMASATRKK